ncbi:MAG TPA: NAD(P)H-hydrate dehydratase [Jatrophihabitans sp.]|nr:NAD(P)H-hydrate dehydratase [Jatrophihabitans sp.]
MTSAADIVTPATLRDWPLPEPGGHKSSRGRVLVIGGARTAPGAALLAGRAALRTGAGVLTIALAEAVASAVGAALPEAGLLWLAEPIGAAAAEVVGDCAAAADAILIGPGLDDPAATGQLLQRLLPELPSDTPVLLDAYALGALRDLDAAVTARLAGRLVLTPNPAEADFLLARDGDAQSQDAPGDQLARLGRIADRFQAVVSCQNHIVAPTGDSWRVPAGHAGLGTSGSGDVLAGAVTGLIARGADLAQATTWGTFLHAQAAERLSGATGPLGFLAGELVQPLPTLLSELTARLA